MKYKNQQIHHVFYMSRIRSTDGKSAQRRKEWGLPIAPQAGPSSVAKVK